MKLRSTCRSNRQLVAFDIRHVECYKLPVASTCCWCGRGFRLSSELRRWRDRLFQCKQILQCRDDIILGIPMGPMGMGIARLVSLEWEWERLDGNGRE